VQARQRGEGGVVILVIGGSGTLGARVVRRVLGAGAPVRVMTRDPTRAATLRGLGAQVVQGDLTEARSLDAACAGVTRALLAAHGFVGRGRFASERVDGDGHRALIDAAARAGVERLVFVSALGAAADHPVDFFRTKFATEQYLAASGLGHVILRPSAFMEFHAHELIGKAVLAGKPARLIGPGTKPRNFVSADDVAALAVRALTASDMDGETIAIGGPGNFGNRQVAELYAQAAGMPLRVSILPAAVARGLARLARPLHPGVARALTLGSLPDSAFDERFDPGALLARYPMTLTRLEDFIVARANEADGRARV
jgi:uncharacterized protein YbjT (DUF2867 family)